MRDLGLVFFGQLLLHSFAFIVDAFASFLGGETFCFE